MKKLYIIGIAALALASAGCSKHDDDKTLDTWNGEIRLASGITTRAGSSDVPDKQIAAGKVVSFYVDDAGTGTAKKNLYENYALTADGNGGFTKDNPQAEDMYYPATGNGVDVYAFLTDGFVSAPTFPATALIHEVKSDQSEPYGTNYLSSDLLYAANKGVVRTPDAVQMNFYHLLSKVEVAIKAGAGAPDLTGAVVTIENTQLKADFLPLKSAEINGTTAEAQAARAGMVTLTADANPTAPIKIGTAVSGDFSSYASAVVVPQTVAKGKRFIKVTLASGGELYYTITKADGLKLKSGNKYQFQITANLTGLTVQSTIADWATGATIEGTAELPVPIGSKKQADAAMGDFYFSDGTLEDKNVNLTDMQKAACIGIVFYAGKHNTDDSNYSGTGIGSSSLHGYVVALQDAGGYLMWEDKNGQYDQVVGASTNNTNWNGYFNSQQIRQYVTNNSWDGWTLEHFPAANACFNFGTTNPKYAVPSSNSGWFMPSAGQLIHLYDNREFLSHQIEKLKGISGATEVKWFSPNNYWSSSEASNDSSYVWGVPFNYGGVSTYSKYLIGNNVRTVSAF